MKSAILFVGLFLASTTYAADIVFLSGSPERLEKYVGLIPPTWLPRILIQGDIASGDERKFDAALANARATGPVWEKDKTVWLDSLGGDVASAMTIGNTIRAGQINTLVMDNASCASACIVILAGGVDRIARDNARLGIHRPYFTNSLDATAQGYEHYRDAYQSVIQRHRDYFQRMGVSNDLLDAMTAIPSNDVRWVTRAYGERVHLLGEDPAYAEWKRAQRTVQKGEACIHYEDNIFACYSKIGADFSNMDDAFSKCTAVVGQPPPNCSVFGGP